MRTQISHILPGCIYCDFDHDPAIECRFQPIHKPEESQPMEHQHEPIKERTSAEMEGYRHIKVEFCACGAIRRSLHLGSKLKLGDWIFPEGHTPQRMLNSILSKAAVDRILKRPIGNGGSPAGPPCDDIHRITAVGVEPLPDPFRCRCIDCGHYFKTKPTNSIDLDQGGEAGALLIWDSDHQLAAKSLCNGLQKHPKLRYVANRDSIMLGSVAVARAKSHTFAKRIAKALNCLSDLDREQGQQIIDRDNRIR